ncbi:MAG: PEP-CTERM sorting domain-containing protein [Burkholderiales bacterium]|nr:PEP-CTERM sorting domain-containing protein [Burkholderiales bacterium]
MQANLKAIVAAAVTTLAVGNAEAQTIVDIKGYGADGAGVAAAYGYPLLPGTTISMTHPVLVSLAAGDYAISDAWGLPGALYDAWDYNVSQAGTWDSHFYAAVQQGRSTAYTLLLDGLSLRQSPCTNPNCSWSTEAQASAAFLATPAFALHLAQPTVVAFSSTDYALGDNAGGMSLLVTAVPEPPAALLIVAGLAWLGARRLRPGR